MIISSPIFYSQLPTQPSFLFITTQANSSNSSNKTQFHQNEARIHHNHTRIYQYHARICLIRNVRIIFPPKSPDSETTWISSPSIEFKHETTHAESCEGVETIANSEGTQISQQDTRKRLHHCARWLKIKLSRVLVLRTQLHAYIQADIKSHRRRAAKVICTEEIS